LTAPSWISQTACAPPTSSSEFFSLPSERCLFSMMTTDSPFGFRKSIALLHPHLGFRSLKTPPVSPRLLIKGGFFSRTQARLQRLTIVPPFYFLWLTVYKFSLPLCHSLDAFCQTPWIGYFLSPTKLAYFPLPHFAPHFNSPCARHFNHVLSTPLGVHMLLFS